MLDQRIVHANATKNKSCGTQVILAMMSELGVGEMEAIRHRSSHWTPRTRRPSKPVSIGLMSKMLVPMITEGSTIILKAVAENSLEVSLRDNQRGLPDNPRGPQRIQLRRRGALRAPLTSSASCA